jgi:hypothetical protein
VDQRITELNQKERDWLKGNLDAATEIVKVYSPRDASNPTTLGALDRAFAAWVISQPEDGQVINSVINAIGISFGQCLVDRLGLRWVIATDDQGTEMAVYREQGNVIIYPANFIAKRWERRETGFIEDSYAKFEKTLAGVQAIKWWVVVLLVLLLGGLWLISRR